MTVEASFRKKLHKKLKLSSERSRSSKEENKKAQRAVYDDKSLKKENGGKRNLKSSGKDKKIRRHKEENDEENYSRGRFKPLNSDGRRKRVYAEQNMGGDVMINDNELVDNKKAVYKKGLNKVKSDIFIEKNGDRSRTIWVSSKKKDTTSETKRFSSKFEDAVETAQVSSTRRRGRGKVDKVDSGRNVSLKKLATDKSASTKKEDASWKKFSDASPSNSFKKIGRNKNDLNVDSDVLVNKPRKRKRIRIDPYDISNKRLDDSIVVEG